MSWAQYEADDLIGTLDKMAETSSKPFDDHCLWGQGFDPAGQMTITVVEISKKGVAEFEEFT